MSENAAPGQVRPATPTASTSSAQTGQFGLVTAIALILGVDRFMSEARALTNLIGNGVATVVVARWEGELDMLRMHAELDGRDYIAKTDPRMAPG